MEAVEKAYQVPDRKLKVWDTPLYKQYWSQKDLVRDTLMFFRLGDFYELFGQDAVEAAPLLEVQLTSRDRKSETPIPMCGVPVHAWAAYAEKLLQKGKKVSLCEQVEEAGQPGKKIVERKVVRVLTPGLPIEFQSLDQKKRHCLMSVGAADQEGGRELSFLEFLAAKMLHGRVKNEDELNELILLLEPREILLPGGCRSPEKISKLFAQREWEARLSPGFSGGSLDNLKEYLKYTQRWDEQELKSFLPPQEPLSVLWSQNNGQLARISPQVLEQWNVFPDLFQALDKCASAVGSRKLREILSCPLQNPERIQLRQRLLKEFTHPQKALKMAQNVYDIERILGRFRVRAARPVELLRFSQSLLAAEALFDFLEKDYTALLEKHFEFEALTPLIENRRKLQSLAGELGRALVLDKELLKLKGLKELLRGGYDPEFDALKAVHDGAQDWLESFEEKLRKENEIPSLKVRFNKIFGFYIEVTKSHLKKVPDSFERRQTMVNAERYTCQELKKKEAEILSAENKIEAKAEEILEGLKEKILELDVVLKAYIEEFAWVDALAAVKVSVGTLERFGTWTYPEILASEDFHFSIQEARHPLVELMQGGGFVANSLSLGAESRILLLTGPNMAGKSTLMRQNGVALLMAQCGFPVAAEEMSMSCASGFFSRMGASDKILQGESTFMVEMKETADILREADSKSFILIDEIGRGTSTRDGLAIAQAVLQYLEKHLNSRVIFATHFHELSGQAKQSKIMKNASMKIKEWKGDLLFLRQLVFEEARSSYGIEVAKMAGLPDKLLQEALKFFKEKISVKESIGRRKKKESVGAESLPLFSFEEPKIKDSDLEKEVAKLDLDELSPRQAWQKLSEFQETLKKG